MTLNRSLSRTLAASITCLALAGVTACGAGSDGDADASDTSSASPEAGGSDDAAAEGAALTVTDPWIKAAEQSDGMSAMFGTLTNDSDEDVQIVGASADDIAGLVELHEVVAGDGGGMVMQQKEGGFVVPAGGSIELTPGGDHIMLMELTGDLQPGADAAVTLELADGTTQELSVAITPFDGADEEYAGGMDHGSMDDDSTDHGGDDDHGDDPAGDDHDGHDHDSEDSTS